MPAERTKGETIAEDYYDSHDADRFYELVWGGEDIHVGLYELGDTIHAASRRTVAAMADKLGALGPHSKVIDLGAGYGGAARYLANRFGCHVSCLNLSAVQNARNTQLNASQGLASKVTVLHGSFENIPVPDHSMDIVWSQDAFLHSSARDRVIAEIDRVLKPGGQLIFTDPMQADDCPPGVLQDVYDRLSLDSLASFAFYRAALGERGFVELSVTDLTPHLQQHYATVKQVLRSDYTKLEASISPAYIQRMMQGLDNWVQAAELRYLAWGIAHFCKPRKV